MYSSSSLDIPKSDIFTEVSKSTKQFLAAKSLWMQFFDSRYRIPKNRTNHCKKYLESILQKNSPAAASLHIPINCLDDREFEFFLKKFRSDPPGTNSITIIMGCFCTHIPISFTMFGWSYCFKILPSCKNFRFCSSGSVILQVFTATF